MQNMDKHILPSIEQFAAYLDGNLSESEMKQMSELVERNPLLNQLFDANTIVDDTIARYTDADIQLPQEIANLDFELPGIEKNENLMAVDDRFEEKDNLYQQEDSLSEEQLFDEIIDEMELETEDVGDLENLNIDFGDDELAADILDI